MTCNFEDWILFKNSKSLNLNVHAYDSNMIKFSNKSCSVLWNKGKALFLQEHIKQCLKENP